MPGKLTVANLEMGRPTVAEALKHLSSELRHARAFGYTALKLIHGYGSSGTGGKIRIAVRKRLTELAATRQVKGVIPGEDFSIFEETTRRALLRCDDLRRDPDLERRNQGITIVIL